MAFLTDAQLQAELEKCAYCEEKPCQQACPAHCSPADFIMAAQIGDAQDIQRAAEKILSFNPLGGVCGAVCPDRHCMAACARSGIDKPIRIPDVQETLVRKAHALGLNPKPRPTPRKQARVAIVGAGPAGLAAALVLERRGVNTEVFESTDSLGGACRLIPSHRLPKEVLEADLDFLLKTHPLTIHTNKPIDDLGNLNEFDAVLLTVGLTVPHALDIAGEEMCTKGWDFLSAPHSLAFRKGRGVAVIGGGAVAVDCAVTARRNGAERVEMFSLENWSEMPLTEKERLELLQYQIHVNGRTRLTGIEHAGDKITGLQTIRVSYAHGDRPLDTDKSVTEPFDPKAVQDVAGSEQTRPDFGHVIVAIGQHRSIEPRPGVFVAGDCALGPTSVVEAVASGKNAAMEIYAHLHKEPHAFPLKKNKSLFPIPGFQQLPVSLETDFFGKMLPSPFLLSAAPPTDGYEQMKMALDAGWGGGIMKTAFDNVPIHIPNQYMFTFGQSTYGNCDNVSGHELDRVCREIEQLSKEFPHQLVAASTGGPVTNHPENDAKTWQANTKKLENAGAMCVEYSLSCPQGGDGTEGDIVSQNAALTATIIDWILQTGDPNIPKLFKLTGAVTSIIPIATAIQEVFARYPQAKAGITLANSFPALDFRKGDKKWDDGVIVGLSGKGIAPISNMTLAKVAPLGLSVSGNGGPMDYKAAAHFLALGAKTVQFCTIAMKYGVGIIDELHSGLSYLLRAKGLGSVADLIGIALPEPVTDFMALSAKKQISDCNETLCVHCGNCARCSYFAIALNEQKIPVTNPERCVGCSICVQKCMGLALHMRDRTRAELAALKES